MPVRPRRLSCCETLSFQAFDLHCPEVNEKVDAFVGGRFDVLQPWEGCSRAGDSEGT